MSAATGSHHTPSRLAEARQLARAGRFDEVRLLLQAATRRGPVSGSTALQIAELYEACGEWEHAVAHYQTCLTSDPDWIPALRGSARCHVRLARLSDAARTQAHFDAAIEHLRHCSTLYDGDPANVLDELGRVMQMRGDDRGAEAAYRRALDLDSGRAQTWNDLASLLAGKRADEAETCARRSLDCDEHFVPALVNLGALLLRRRSFDEATERLQCALALAPDAPVVHANLGACWLQRGETQRAVTHLQHATAASPGYVRAWLNLGTAFERMADFQAARQNYERAAQLEPSNAKARQNLGMLDLLHGDYASGWRNYEARRQLFPPQVIARYKNPVDPEQLAASLDAAKRNAPRSCGPQTKPRLLVHAEQGFGDTIQFVRFIPRLSEAYDVAFHCQPELIDWVARLDLKATLIPNDTPPPEHDGSAPLLSLGATFLRTEADIPPPLAVRGGVGDDDRGQRALTLGIAWRGNPAHDNDVNRSIELAALAGLRIPADWRVCSLDWDSSNASMTAIAAQLARVLERPVTPALLGARDFATTADVVQQLDLVVSVDTALAHLAASSHVSTWLVLPAGPDWRWGTRSTSSPWYPTLRLFRQRAARDWSVPLADISAAMARVEREAMHAALAPNR